MEQTYENLEIILVDDGSPDNCPSMCDAWAEQDSRIKVIHKENGGLSDARNAGLAVATGELIAFVDSDDWIELDFIRELYAAMESTGADIAACGVAYVDESGAIARQRLTYQLIGTATISLGNQKGLIAPYRKAARKELRQRLRDVLTGSGSKKLKLMALWAAIYPWSYCGVHKIYSVISGTAYKYEI